MSDNQRSDEAHNSLARFLQRWYNGLCMLTIKHLRKCLLAKGLDN